MGRKRGIGKQMQIRSLDFLFYEITIWKEMTTDFACADAVCGSWWFR